MIAMISARDWDFGSMTNKQPDRIERSFAKKIDDYATSDAFKAMQADVEMFGAAACTLHEA